MEEGKTTNEGDKIKSEKVEFRTPTNKLPKQSLTPVLHSPSDDSSLIKRKLFSEETSPSNKKRKIKKKEKKTNSEGEEEDEEEFVISLTKTPSMTYPTEPISFKNLLVTQNVVRNKESLLSLIQALKEGKKFPNILVFSFPDGKSFLHDGHHRVLALYLTGRDKLYENEYVVIHSTYEAMSKPIFEKQFVTPYDPRVEIRLGEFGEFKRKAIELSKIDERDALNFINDNRDSYCTKRNVTTIHSLAEILGYSPSDFTPSDQ